jgi:hypothetical protein
MQRREFVAHLLGRGAVVAVSAGACFASGCGTVFYPERRYAPHSNQIDWKIAALDGLGLLLFFVPGVVAFAVDFVTGAIYLPIEEAYPCYGAWEPPPPPGYYPAGPQLIPPQPVPAAQAALVPQPLPEAHYLPEAPPLGTQTQPTPAQPTPEQPTLAEPIQSQPTPAEMGLKRLSVPREELQPRRIEQVVAAHVGRRVSLDDDQARLSALSKIEQFGQQAERHRSDRSFGFGVRAYFARLMQA